MKNNKFVVSVLLPGMVILLLFSFVPLVYGLGISLFDYNPANSSNAFLGLENYVKLFQDPRFIKASINTIVFSLVASGLNIVIALFLSTSISSLKFPRLKTLFRTIVFLPCVAPMVGTALVWKYGALDTKRGLLNLVRMFFGRAPVNWFLTEHALMVIIIVFTIWADIGYNTILFTAGLENIPKEFIEAAQIDGANSRQTFFKVKLPLMGRNFAFVAIMTMIDYLQMFTQFSILAASGGHNDAALVLSTYIYNTSFSYYDMGYASAISTALFVIVLVVTLVQRKFTKTDWSYN